MNERFQPNGQTGVTAIAGNGKTSLALTTNGTVVAWGDNSSGQTNIPIAAQTGVVAISAGSDFSLALKSDGSVVAWGFNGTGQTIVPLVAQSNVVAMTGSNMPIPVNSDLLTNHYFIESDDGRRCVTVLKFNLLET